MSFSDIDECSGGSPCHADATCQNQIGSYECICNEGIFLFAEIPSPHTVYFKIFPCS